MQRPVWKITLAKAIKDIDELLRFLEIPVHERPSRFTPHSRFPIRVPLAYAKRMKKGDINDPLLLQVLPQQLENIETPGYSVDPVGDLLSIKTHGVMHKYAGRVLLVTTGACAIHCRYCFRRHFPYNEINAFTQQWQPALNYINADPSVQEVILSGGDPLMLSDRHLSALHQALEAIAHIHTLRIHTRLPVVVPERVDDELVKWVERSRLKIVIVIHANHPNEIDGEVVAALNRLKRSNVTLLNQTVLLRHVNDNANCLAALSERLFHAGVLPYYLHQLDRVQGAAHFEVDNAKAVELIQALRSHLPGYLVPKLVQEITGGKHKYPVY